MKRFYLLTTFLITLLSGCASTGAPGDIATNAPAPADTRLAQATTVPTGAASPQGVATSGAVASPAIAATATRAPVPATPSAAATATGVPTRVVAPARQVNLPAGFGISVFASGLNTPRNIALGPDGQLYVAERGAGRIVRLADRNRDGVSDGKEVVASGFNLPSSLAFFKDGSLYVSTATQVFRLSQPDANGVYQKRDVLIDGLPGPQDHFTRTLLFSPDWSSLFIQVGSSCNVCRESDERRATIMRFNADGGSGAVYARGLRNAVGITFRPNTNELWASNNGTDNLGDNQPPDTIQIVQQGQDYGWPRCHAGSIADPQFGGANACSGVTKPLVNIQAHSAALGLGFYSGNQFPAEYRGDLFVALHGSIFRNVPTGYKVVRVHLNNGQPSGDVQDFASGWLVGSQAWGRPVDVLSAPDGSLWVSDDSGGIIYRIFNAGS